MDVDSDDALIRYGQARIELAAVDAEIEAIGLKAHTAAHGAPLSPEALNQSRTLLRQLMTACEAFGTAAAELAETLGPAVTGADIA